jgi:hypothetical protein
MTSLIPKDPPQLGFYTSYSQNGKGVPQMKIINIEGDLITAKFLGSKEEFKLKWFTPHQWVPVTQEAFEAYQKCYPDRV